MMNCCGFALVQWVSESAQEICLKSSSLFTGTLLIWWSVSERGHFYCLWLIRPRLCPVGPWKCLPSKVKHFEFLLCPLISEGRNCVTLGLVRRLRDHFWGPVMGGSWQSTCGWCLLTFTSLVGHTFQCHGWTSGARSHGCRNVTNKSIHEQTTCVNRLCKWKHKKHLHKANAHIVAWPSLFWCQAQNHLALISQFSNQCPRTENMTPNCSAHLVLPCELPCLLWIKWKLLFWIKLWLQ